MDARCVRETLETLEPSHQDGIPNAAPPSRHALRDARNARANSGL